MYVGCMGIYDTIIVGGGPVGLTLATYLTGKVLLIDHESIGGCHKVRRQENSLFAEHGPRVYCGAFVNFNRVLVDIGTSWDAIFKQIKFSPELIDGKIWAQTLSVLEILAVSYEYVMFVLGATHSKNVSVSQFCQQYNFSEASTTYLDAVCRFSDGAGADRYSLFEFLNGFDQHMLYSFYEPKNANDRVLFPIWKQHLETRGVTILEQTHVHEILHDRGNAVGVRLGSNKVIHGNRIILAMPPISTVPLLRASYLTEPGFETYAKLTKYEPYWSVAFHYDTDAAVLDHVGMKSTPWGLVYIEMPFTDEPFRIVSVAATKWDVPSPKTGKTLRTMQKERLDGEIIKEIQRQLPVSREPKAVVVPRGVHRDHSFVAAANTSFMHPRLTCCKGLYSVGTHNGQSTYNFTSIESAVQNALSFCDRRKEESLTVSGIIRLGIALGALYMLKRVGSSK